MDPKNTSQIVTRDTRSSAPAKPSLPEERAKLEKEISDAEHELGHAPDLAAGTAAALRMTEAKKNLAEFERAHGPTAKPEAPRGNKLGLQAQLTIPGTISCAALELEKFLSAEERKALIEEESQYREYQELITQNSHTTVNERLSKRRSDLMTAGGPLTQAELESFTKSAKEEKELAAERLRIAYARSEAHSYQKVLGLCVIVYRKLLPRVDAMIAEAEKAEIKLHAQWNLDRAVLPVTQTIRNFVERLRSHVAELETTNASGGSYGPKDRLGLLIDWARIETPPPKSK